MKMKLTRDIIKAVEEMATLGMYNVDIAHNLQINKGTFYNWQKIGMDIHEQVWQGDKDEKSLNRSERLYYDFFNSLKRAQSEAVKSALGRIRKAGRESWQAEAWFLERTRPDDFGRRERHQIEHSGKIAHTLSPEDEERLEEEMQEFFKVEEA
ncbi:MAG: hypothetical protein GF388_00925 [Candidatus Aegiribacteria sp.]|nr:hypothetical protein [Candidatus Aegiribacteria sp.]